MQRILKYIDTLSSWGGAASGASIVLITSLILIEIAVRTLSGRSTFITEEYSAYLLVCFVFLGMSYTLREDGHIRVNLVLSRLKAPWRDVAELCCAVLGFFAFAYLTWYVTILFLDSLSTGVTSMHVSKTPLCIPRAIPVIGSLMMALQFLCLITRTVLALVHRTPPQVSHG